MRAAARDLLGPELTARRYLQGARARVEKAIGSLTPISLSSCAPQAVAALAGVTPREAAVELVAYAAAAGRGPWWDMSGDGSFAVDCAFAAKVLERWRDVEELVRPGREDPPTAGLLARTGLAWLASIASPRGGGHALAIAGGRIRTGDWIDLDVTCAPVVRAYLVTRKGRT